MRDFSKLKLGVVVVSVFFFLMLLICMIPYWTDLCNGEGGCSKIIFKKANDTLSAVHRKLLRHSLLAIDEPNRVWGEMCTSGDISISQGRSAPLPSGIPAFRVEISNACVTGCNISRIHLNCGWFSSFGIIDPKIFKRLRYNDCLVNDGKPLLNGGSVTFHYVNTFPYPLSVSSIVCS